MAKKRFYSNEVIRAGSRVNPRLGNEHLYSSDSPFGPVQIGRWGYCQNAAVYGCTGSDYNAWLSSITRFYKIEYSNCKKSFEKALAAGKIDDSKSETLIADIKSAEAAYKVVRLRGPASFTTTKGPNYFMEISKLGGPVLGGILRGSYYTAPIEDIILAFEKLAVVADAMNDAGANCAGEEPDPVSGSSGASSGLSWGKILGYSALAGGAAYLYVATKY